MSARRSGSGRPVRRLRIVLVLALAAAGALASGADAAITITSGANTVSTSGLDLDFGNSNVEQLDSVKWRGSDAVLGGNLASNGGVPGCGNPPEPSFSWGEAGSAEGQGMPAPLGPGTTGTWTPRGRRSVEIVSSRPTGCTGDSVVTPVRTRYTFFDVGAAASKIRVERTFSFSPGTPNYTATVGMRPYIPQMPGDYSNVLHPNANGTALILENTSAQPTAITTWNKTWFAINRSVGNSGLDSGLLILRETPSTTVRLILQDDGTANSSSVDLVRPTSPGSGGWHAPITETEWLCFYDATSWPSQQRTPTNLPSGCSITPVPINTAAPVITGTAKVGNTLSATAGTWDYSTGVFDFQWLRCGGGGCTAIPGATGSTYKATDADEGNQLRVDVTATASGGQTDTASAITDGTKPGPPQNTALPPVSGEARARETLTGGPGSWTGSPTSFQYQWLRCPSAAGTNCLPISGATTSTYKLVRDDVGSTLRLRVTAVNALGSSVPADSAATGVVQAEVIRARFTISPNPSCTGLAVRLDGSGSTTPNEPIVRYRWTYKQYSLPAYVFVGIFGGQDAADQYIAGLPNLLLADGADATPTPSFNWNRQLDHDEAPGRRGDYARDTILMTLTVTDRAGAQASVNDNLGFAQTYSSASRAGCPRAFHEPAFVAFAKARDLSVFATAFRATVPCASFVDCFGALQVVHYVPRRTRRGRVAAAATTRAPATKAVVLASSGLFTIPARKSGRVSAKLTRTGRRLLRPGRLVRVRVRITSITPSGRRVTRSFSTTLRRRK